MAYRHWKNSFYMTSADGLQALGKLVLLDVS